MMATATSLNYVLLRTCLTGKALLYYSWRRMRQREGRWSEVNTRSTWQQQQQQRTSVTHHHSTPLSSNSHHASAINNNKGSSNNIIIIIIDESMSSWTNGHSSRDWTICGKRSHLHLAHVGSILPPFLLSTACALMVLLIHAHTTSFPPPLW
jgi:hypothetical protein